jgi:RNA-directed DNA polymerase
MESRAASASRQALLNVGLEKKVNWARELNIRRFLDTIDHGWLMKSIEHGIAGRRVVRLIGSG